QVDEAVAVEVVGAREREPARALDAETAREMAEIVADRERGGSEDPGLPGAPKNAGERPGNVEGREVEAHTARVYVDPAQAVEGLVVGEQRQPLARRP